MSTDWPAYAPDLPRDLIAAGIPVSALFVLEPLMNTMRNDALHIYLDEPR